MASNGFFKGQGQNQANNGADNNNSSSGGIGQLDEDLRRKVESLQIGDHKAELENVDPSNVGGDKNGSSSSSKSYSDWKDELPIHLKSLKFMIDVLNDRHSNANSNVGPPSSGNHHQFGPSFRNLPEFLGGKDKEKEMDAFGSQPPYSSYDNGDGLVFRKRPLRAKGGFPATTRNNPRRRTKSAEPDLSSYRNETPYGSFGVGGTFGTRSYKHRNSDGGLGLLTSASASTKWYNRRRSVDLNVANMKGVHIVEEISEEEEFGDDGSPDSLLSMDLNMELNLLNANAANQELNLLNPDSVSSPYHQNQNVSSKNNSNSHAANLRLRRDLWNISPISEDFSESDKELGLGDLSSTNATFGEGEELDELSIMSISSRHNCSSPILAHSPSLRKTPIATISNNGLAVSNTNTPPGPGSGGEGKVGRKVRDFARALDDISDKDEDHTTASESDEPELDPEPEDQTSDEEKTESFEIDLKGVSGELLLNTSFTRDKSPSPSPSFNKDAATGGESSQPASAVSTEGEDKTTVWEALSANIQAHIGVGNPAGFVERPVEHPLQNQTQTQQQPDLPSYMNYDKPLGSIPKLN